MDENQLTEDRITLTQVRYEFLISFLKRMHSFLTECAKLQILDFIPLKRFAMELGFQSVEDFHLSLRDFLECVAAHPVAFRDLDTLAKECDNNTVESANVFVARVKRIVAKESKEYEPNGESIQKLYQRLDEAIRDFLEENQLDWDYEIQTTKSYDDTGYLFCPKCNKSAFDYDEIGDGDTCKVCGTKLVPHTQYNLFTWRLVQRPSSE